jgi:hypothetical protein
VDKANTVQDLCGEKTYTIKDGSGNTITTWAAITEDTTARTYVLTIDTTQYAYSASTATENLSVETRLTTWGANAGSDTAITVTITPVGCNCAALAWSAGSVNAVSVNIDASQNETPNVPVSSDAARSTDTAFATCYDSGNACVTTGSYANGASDFKYKLITDSSYSALPAWITWSSTDLVFAPTDPALVGTYQIAGTYTPTHGTAAEYQVVTLTVSCEVTSMTVPANPTTGLTHYIKGSPLVFDYSTAWVQSPACGYTFTSSFTWTGTSGNSFMTTSGGELIVQEFDNALSGNTYNVEL